jgi:catechol 2,3-dioxygenase-like lactoylglutathione lyase family enzyme
VFQTWPVGLVAKSSWREPLLPGAEVTGPAVSPGALTGCHAVQMAVVEDDAAPAAPPKTALIPAVIVAEIAAPASTARTLCCMRQGYSLPNIHGAKWSQNHKSALRVIGALDVPPGTMSAMLDHVSIQCQDVAASARFYDAVLAPLGGQRIMDFGQVIGYGVPPRPDFWLGPQATGEGFREAHLAFVAADRGTVRAFFDAAVGQGAEVLHSPRVWPEYHANYYGAFVRDPDGNNVEAVCHGPEVDD